MLKPELLGRLESWVEAVLAEEAELSELDEELLTALEGEGEAEAEAEEPDLFTLHAGLVALRQEIRVQGREFARLHDRLPAGVASSGGTPKGEPDSELLLDLRDRLLRGVETARKHLEELEGVPPPGMLARLLGWDPRPREHALEASGALLKGSLLTLDRLDQALARAGIRELPCQGVTFDPATMEVIDMEERSDLEEGTILEVLRRGYLLREIVLRMAQVRVSRIPPGRSSGDSRGSQGS